MKKNKIKLLNKYNNLIRKKYHVINKIITNIKDTKKANFYNLKCDKINYKIKVVLKNLYLNTNNFKVLQH